MHDREIQICHGEADRTVWLTSSCDEGRTWAEPVEISGTVKSPEWAWYATGPGHGIQLTSGRLVIPCDHSLLIQSPGGEIAYHSHIIFSDDHGQTWQIGGSAPEGTNESTVVETMDGLLYLNARNAPRYQYQPDGSVSTQRAALYRAAAWSEDGGISFPHYGHNQALIEPICHASVCRLTDHLRHDRDRVIFSNPASQARENLTVRLSYDECRTWPVSRVLHPGGAQYSDLCVTGGLTICCLYERSEDHKQDTIIFAQFDLAWLEENSGQR
jgi:sialidase-1